MYLVSFCFPMNTLSFQAEGLVLSLRDLFQVVFEMKKKEVEQQKQKKEADAGTGILREFAEFRGILLCSAQI